DANQSRQRSSGDAPACTQLMTSAAPAAATAAPIALAAKKPRTWKMSSSLNSRPNQRSSSQAVSSACPALTKPKTRESEATLPIATLARMVAIATAAATGKRAVGPNTIKAPTAMPAAGQNTATPGLVIKIKPRRAATK